MEKIWLKSYPPGVPAEIDWKQHRSVGELFQKNCALFGDRPAYHNMGATISFRELEQQSAAFGAWLQGMGLARGARVALMMPNCLQFPICIFGTLRAGCTVVNVNPLYTPRELEYQLKDSGAEVIVILENFAHVLQQVKAATQVKHVVVASLGDRLGFMGVIVNFVVRHLQRLVPAWNIPGALRFNALMEEGAGRSLKPVEVVPPAYPRGRRCCTGTSSPISSRRLPGCIHLSWSGRIRSSSPRCRFTIYSHLQLIAY